MADEQTIEDWSSNSTEALQLSLIAPKFENGIRKVETLYTFEPLMTYSIFGDEESIFGYKGLKIQLRFGATDMRPNLHVFYTKKFKAVGDTEADDLKLKLEELLPKNAFEKQSIHETYISSPELANWKPPGELWQSFVVGGKTQEIWRASLTDLAAKQLVKRMQILARLYIEGGTEPLPPGEDEDEEDQKRWTLFFSYQKDTAAASSQVSPYTFMGYSTVYKFFPILKYMVKPDTLATISNEAAPIPQIDFSSVPCRSRIAQFILLQPFHGEGNGSRFYSSIFEFLHKELQTAEITVEDPNEAFDDMRDLNDLKFLRSMPEFSGLKINTKSKYKENAPNDIVDAIGLEKLRMKAKIAPRQFYRIVEMQLLSTIPIIVRKAVALRQQQSGFGKAGPKNEELIYYLWQLLVKKRLYRHNKQQLMQLDRTERIEKLEDAMAAVEDDYGRLLQAYEVRAKQSVAASEKDKGKREAPEDSSSDDVSYPPTKKKIKVVVKTAS
ncbi:acyl-CoA N-acyltransferase [Calycina marina]|uniref:Histone acetyltransferase type B catalytic subunit n=1 Tax=Calycina marina TaxID=1763456 RepID=A0A9P7Z217_9HELO|nr:acyl-CoA N-acyltransferase [Calycina marina]